MPAGTVLDGELVAGSGRARSFYRLGSVLATRPEHRDCPLTFVAFDLLAVDGRCVTPLAYQERRGLLEELGLAGSAWCTAPRWLDMPVEELLRCCEQVDIEGLVAKRLKSPYRPGQRSVDWVKVKTSAWRTVHAPHRHKQAAR